jgi:hypothetical protein
MADAANPTNAGEPHAPAVGVVQGTLVEAVDGPAAIEALVGKGMPVLTRLASGARGFRILSRIEPTESPVAVMRLALDNGRTIELAAEQQVYTAAGGTVRVAHLHAGDRLLPSFHYPPGYRLSGEAGEAGAEQEEAPGLAVVSVAACGENVVYRGHVKETGCMFLNAGILCLL